MKIIIIGAGITGLSTYLYLQKHLPATESHSISIIEAYDTSKLSPKLGANTAELSNTDADGTTTSFASAVVGSALGVSANGLNCLRRIDADGSTKTLDRILGRGSLVTKWDINCARGWKLAEAKLCPDSQQTVMKDDKSLGPALMIVRQHLWEELRNAVVESGGEILVKRVFDVSVDESGGQAPVTVHFSDGTTDDADLVIGADGLKSVVRKVMFAGEKEKGIDLVTPHYEGLAGIGGWLPASVLKPIKKLQQNSMSITFGPNGFFGCGYMTPSSHSKNSEDEGIAGWWSTYALLTPPPTTTTKIEKQQTINMLLKRHGWWKQPFIAAILNYVDQHREDSGLIDVEYGTYTTPPLPTFSKYAGRLVLLGDSAHALQPSSGQGACQALEDAEAYATLLGNFLTSSSPSALEQTAKSLDALRLPRIRAIYERSQKMGGMKKEMNVFIEHFVYLMIWCMSWFHDKYNKELMQYDLPKEAARVFKDAM